MAKCPLCKTSETELVEHDQEIKSVNCVACGHYKVIFPNSVRDWKNQFSDHELFHIAYWVSEQNRMGAPPVVTIEAMISALKMPAPTIEKRLAAFLRCAVELVSFSPGGVFQINHPKLRLAGYCAGPHETRALGRYWEARDAVEISTVAPGQCRLTAQGLLIFEEEQKTSGQSKQGFVAMWFHAELQVAYEQGIASAVRSAGYEPVRIDQVHHDGRIDDRIIAEIRRSKFVIADFTGHRGGVYYEAGFAHGLGLPVVFGCRVDHFEGLHFDVRQYNTIIWNDVDSLRTQLHNRLLALFGAGPNAPDASAIT